MFHTPCARLAARGRPAGRVRQQRCNPWDRYNRPVCCRPSALPPSCICSLSWRNEANFQPFSSACVNDDLDYSMKLRPLAVGTCPEGWCQKLGTRFFRLLRVYGRCRVVPRDDSGRIGRHACQLPMEDPNHMHTWGESRYVEGGSKETGNWKSGGAARAVVRKTVQRIYAY